MSPINMINTKWLQKGCIKKLPQGINFDAPSSNYILTMSYNSNPSWLLLAGCIER